jgi:hypothetical protein
MEEQIMSMIDDEEEIQFRLARAEDSDPNPWGIHDMLDAIASIASRMKDPTIAPVSPMCDFEQPDGWCGGPDGCTDYHEWLKDQGEDPRIESWWRNR